MRRAMQYRPGVALDFKLSWNLTYWSRFTLDGFLAQNCTQCWLFQIGKRGQATIKKTVKSRRNRPIDGAPHGAAEFVWKYFVQNWVQEAEQQLRQIIASIFRLSTIFTVLFVFLSHFKLDWICLDMWVVNRSQQNRYRVFEIICYITNLDTL